MTQFKKLFNKKLENVVAAVDEEEISIKDVLCWD